MVCRIGAGSARPVVSTKTRSKSAIIFLTLEDQALQGVEQIAAHRAAEAAAVQQNGFLIDLGDEGVVDADLAEFIDNHRHPVHFRVLDQFAEQRRFAGAKKAGDHRDWQPVMGRGLSHRRLRGHAVKQP